jgi:hypothetical protein
MVGVTRMDDAKSIDVLNADSQKVFSLWCDSRPLRAGDDSIRYVIFPESLHHQWTILVWI